MKLKRATEYRKKKNEKKNQGGTFYWIQECILTNEPTTEHVERLFISCCVSVLYDLYKKNLSMYLKSYNNI